ncbi:very long chain fatty acid elongase 7-like [Onthophagus taurus]|uniref:very long chain fatty acid elongase 7-like n=1 Tax=Onthophagus taurus TaxID=166361 RepID=UPI000C20A668|nr:elongation of very long chain fatty acids protein 7-like [Onthophagus taurus]
MSSFMHMMVDNYNEVLDAKKDPLVDSWLFMKSPLPVVSILILYLYFVLYLGPKLMKNRKPFDLKNSLIAYNAYQVVFSLWLCSNVMIFKEGIMYNIVSSCSTSESFPYKLQVSTAAWWYFFSKIVELLDTVFFVLRKKQSQVTFLHVYHHSIMTFFSWCYLKLLPAEQMIFIGFLNTSVHIVMYSYYLIAALGPQYQKYLWWKKYMTWIQLGQFCIMLAYLSALVIMDCKLPKALTFFFVGNVAIFLYLFSDFYRKAYKKKPKLIENGTHSDPKNITTTLKEKDGLKTN